MVAGTALSKQAQMSRPPRSNACFLVSSSSGTSGASIDSRVVRVVGVYQLAAVVASLVHIVRTIGGQAWSAVGFGDLVEGGVMP